MRKEKKNNKRYTIKAILIATLIVSVLAGCGKKGNTTTGNITVGDVSTGNAVIGDTTAGKTETGDVVTGDIATGDINTGDTSTGNVSTGTPLEKYGALAVEGTDLVDCDGNPIQLRGVSTAGLSWFPQFANKDAFATMQSEWNIEIVRLAMYTAEYNGYCVGDEANRETLKNLVKDSVEAATELGLYVIVDWHILSDNNPNTHKSEAIAFFTEMASEFKDYDNVLYEICNEPNGGTSWSDIKSYAEDVIPVIREQDEDAIILVGTPTWSQDVDQAAADPITEYDNIMYTLHFYAATHKESLRNKMVDAIEDGLPIFVSEFGICSASGDGALDYAEAANWIATMNENNISYCSWNLSNKNETSALLSSGTSKTSGWTVDELSEYGKWLVELLNGNLDLVGTASQGNSGAGSQGSSGVSGSQGSTGSQSSQNGTAASSANSTDLVATATVSNSWESDGKYYYQYDISTQNNMASEKSDWAVKITFSENVTVDQSWSCNQSVSGKVLTITAADWNQKIAADSTLKDIGLILYSTGESTISSITI